jgi:hypothetical protein
MPSRRALTAPPATPQLDLPLPAIVPVAEPSRLQALALREVAAMQPALLSALPEPTSLVLRACSGAVVIATTSADVYAAHRSAGECVLTGGELGALAIGAEQDRASGPWLATWLAARDASLRLDVTVVLGGVEGDPTPVRRWSLARVLRAWGLELVRVGVGSPVEWCNPEEANA